LFKDFLNLASEAKFTILGGKLFPTFTTRSLKKVVGQVVGRVLATDADSAANSRIVYSLPGAAGNDSTSSWFSVDPRSGNVSARVAFDREFVDRFQFVVLASSGHTTSQVGSTSLQSCRRQWRRQGREGGSFQKLWTSKNYVLCVCFHWHGTSSYHTTNTLQGRRAKSHVDTQTIQPGLGDFVL